MRPRPKIGLAYSLIRKFRPYLFQNLWKSWLKLQGKLMSRLTKCNIIFLIFMKYL